MTSMIHSGLVWLILVFCLKIIVGQQQPAVWADEIEHKEEKTTIDYLIENKDEASDDELLERNNAESRVSSDVLVLDTRQDEGILLLNNQGTISVL